MNNFGQIQDPIEENSAGKKFDNDRKRRDIDRDLAIAEADLRKLLQERSQLDMEIRGLKKNEAQIKVEIQDFQQRITKIEQEIFLLENEIKSLKKKLNML